VGCGGEFGGEEKWVVLCDGLDGEMEMEMRWLFGKETRLRRGGRVRWGMEMMR
jgi:hypothetical protein